MQSHGRENRVLVAHTVGDRQQDTPASNCQAGELRGGSVSQLGLELMEGRRTSQKREARAEPRGI